MPLTLPDALLEAIASAQAEENQPAETALLLLLRAQSLPVPVQRRLVNITAELLQVMEWAGMEEPRATPAGDWRGGARIFSLDTHRKRC